MLDPAWVALSLTRHLGGKTFRALLAAFNHDLNAILAADSTSLRSVPGVGPKIAQAIQAIDLRGVEQAIQRWQDAGVEIVPLDHATYPRRLKRLDDAPPTLFVSGTLPVINSAYAIIGTRTPNAESIATAQNISSALARRGSVIVSGLAFGIDAAAHLGSLSVPDGQTIAVLGSGVLNVYPRQHQELAQAIKGRGALVCEVGPDTEVSTPGLVARNRIISGLCDGVIVIETGRDGGAMHAVRFARVQGVPVYAAANNASGNQELLKTGALPLEHLLA